MKKSIKSVLALALAFVMVVGSVSVGGQGFGAFLDVLVTGASAEDEQSPEMCGANATWVIDDNGTLTISGFGAMADYAKVTERPWYSYRNNIKSVVIGNGITNIGDYAFHGCANLISVTIPDSVTKIGQKAFALCKSISSFNIPDSVTSIGAYAFQQCTSLISVVFGNGAIEFDEQYGGIFNRCTSLTDVTFMDYTVTSIPQHMFDGCTALTEIVIPFGVTAIGNYAFANCNALISITIPDSVTNISEKAFTNYSENLVFICGNGSGAECFATQKGIKVIPSVHLDSVDCGNGNYARWHLLNDGTLIVNGSGTMADYAKVTERPWHSYRNNIKSVVIGNGITNIGDYAFGGCANLISVTIPDSVTSIGNNAFGSCTGLTNITFGNGLFTIGDYAFRQCTSVTAIDLPESVESIGKYAFLACTDLTRINIPNSVKNIGAYAFSQCTSLECLSIPDSVESIGEYGAFRNCTGLTSVTIGGGISVIVSQTFAGCTALTEIVIPFGVTTIGDNAFLNCKALTSVTIPDSVTSISKTAFSKCNENLVIKCHSGSYAEQFAADNGIDTSYIDVSYSGDCGKNGDNVKWALFDDGKLVVSGSGEMFNYAKTSQPWRDYADRIRSIVVENGVKTIGQYAFYGCVNLENISIAESVNRIFAGAFQNCINLEKIFIPKNVNNIHGLCFKGCNLKQIVVDENNTMYDSRDNCNAIIKSSINTLAIGCQNTVIPDTITEIGSNAFTGCIGLENIVIPDSVNAIRGLAFKDCPNLVSVSISDNTVHIVNNVFTNCSDDLIIECSYGSVAGQVAINNRIKTKYTNAESFGDCGKDDSYVRWYLIDGQLIISGYGDMTSYQYEHLRPWYNACCTDKIKSIVIEGEITEIGNYAFCGCHTQDIIEIPETVSLIGNSAFADTNIVSVEIHAHTINPSAFSGCFGLLSVKIGSEVEAIAVSAFNGCDNLETIVVDETNGIYDSRNGCNAIVESGSGKLILGCKNTRIPDDGAITIGKNAFYNCKGLTGITIPANVTGIDASAFKNCFNLETIVVDETNGKYDSRNSCNAIVETDSNTLIFGCKNTTIPEGVTRIGNGAFLNCTGLKTITIPDGVTDIGKNAFSGCMNLAYVFIPKSVTSIGTEAFYACGKIELLKYGGNLNDWEKIGKEALKANKIIYDCSSVDTFFEGNIGENIRWSFDGYETLTISGSGAMANFNSNTQPWSFCSESIKSVVIEGEITSIGNYAFCRYANLTSVEIRKGVEIESIGTRAFLGCTGLTSITIPDSDSDMSIGDGAFISCTSLTSINIPKSVTSVGKNAFSNCENLCYVSFYTTAEIMAYAFSGCSSLNSVYITKGTETDACSLNIHSFAFNNCTNLKNVYYSGNENSLEKKPDCLSDESIRWHYSSYYQPKAYCITFSTNGGEFSDGETEKEFTYRYGESVGTFDQIPTRDGYNFAGWTEIPLNMPSKEVTVSARWVRIIEGDNIFNLGDDTYNFVNSRYGNNEWCRDEKHEGHCFGMSITSAGYFLGILSKESFNGDSVYTVSSTKDSPVISKIYSTICHYQENYNSKCTVCTGWTNVVNYVKSGVYNNTGELVLIIRGYKGNGESDSHAVTFLRYENVCGQDRICVYDPNQPSAEEYFYCENNTICTRSGSFVISYITGISIYDVRTYFDLAGVIDI